MLRVVFMLMSILLCFGIPVGWFLSVRHGKKGYIGVLIGGALSFYLFQMIIRIPILQLLLPKFEWYQSLAENTIGIAIFLGLTAALFETAGRSLTLNLLLKKRLSYKTGLVHGIGHGGIEAILLVGINYIFYAAYTFLYVRGVEQPMLFMFPAETQELMHTLVLDINSVMFLIAGLERAMTMIVHVGLSLLITVGILRGQQLLYTFIVIGLHSSLDFFAVVMSVSDVNFWYIEAMVLVFAVMSVGIILYFKGRVKDEMDRDAGESAVEEGY